MPQTDKDLRAKFMVNGSDGIQEAITLIRDHGGSVYKGRIAIAQADYSVIRDAVVFLVEEWDFDCEEDSDHQEMVRQFHYKMEFPVGLRLSSLRGAGCSHIVGSAIRLEQISKNILGPALNNAQRGDPRLYRAYLMIEELAETVGALAMCDDVELADGLADLEYTMLGTAVTFSIPSRQVFKEVHRSNMTKSIDKDLARKGRMKGPEFSPADVRGVLERHMK